MQTLPTPTITPNTNSVLLSFPPFPGAEDYRVYKQESPNKLKYAGLLYLKSGNRPALELEVNGLSGPTVLILEAVDSVGPVPPCNIIDIHGLHVYPEMPSESMPCLPGSNMGDTPDGKVSTNGQGDPSNNPQVLARSNPFTVTPTLKPVFPSTPNVEQVFCDYFDSASTPVLISKNPKTDTALYSFKSATSWTAQYFNADVNASQIFFDNLHLMDVLSDGGSQLNGVRNSGQPIHTQYGTLALSPDLATDISGGKTYHATFEVDSNFSARRWVDYVICPYDDHLTNTREDPSIKMNLSGQYVFIQIQGTSVSLKVNGTQQVKNYSRPQTPSMQGYDRRVRFDVYITATTVALYESGRLLFRETLTTPLSYTKFKSYLLKYAYHLILDHTGMLQWSPYQTYIIKYYPYIMESHWSAFATEVLI